jgi:PKHD-type hydroxylase
MSLCKKEVTLKKGRVGYGELKETRKSSVGFISKVELIDERLKTILKENIHIKGFEVTGLGEYQFTEYSVGEYYDWHVDTGKMYNNRYYSIVIQLNEEYEGGILEIENIDKSVMSLKRGVGHLYIFQSSILHRVAPVTDGVRYSLVNWVSLNQIENFKKTLI